MFSTVDCKEQYSTVRYGRFDQGGRSGREGKGRGVGGGGGDGVLSVLFFGDQITGEEGRTDS